MLYDFDDWRELVSVFFDVEALSPEKAFKAEVEFRRHSQAIASNTRFSAQKFTHQPGSIRGVDHDYLLFERYLSGSGRGLASDIPTAIDPSVLHVVDLSRAYCTITTDVVTNGLLIPHEAVGYDPSRHAAYYSVPVASLKGRVLLAAHEALDEAIAASLPPAEELESAFVSLVGSLLLGDTDERARAVSGALTKKAVKQEVSRCLMDPGLSADGLCRRLGLSRSNLYRLFAGDGGVMRYVADRRLDACFAELAGSPDERGRVSGVAKRWGYHDLANFNRAFRKRFGVRPSECVGTGRSVATHLTGRSIHPVHQWIRNA